MNLSVRSDGPFWNKSLNTFGEIDARGYRRRNGLLNETQSLFGFVNGPELAAPCPSSLGNLNVIVKPCLVGNVAEEGEILLGATQESCYISNVA